MSSSQCRSLDPGAWSRCARSRFHDEDHWDGHPNGAHWSDDTAAVVDNRESDLLNAKASAWDAYVGNIERAMGTLSEETDIYTYEEETAVRDEAKGIKSLCERYGLESPF